MADPKNQLRNQLDQLGAITDPRAFECLTTADEFSIWSDEGKFLGASLGFLRFCSYTEKELCSGSLKDLYTSDLPSSDAFEAGLTRLANGASCITDVLPYHTVTEAKPGGLAVTVNVKAMCVLRDRENQQVFGFIMIGHYR